MKAPSKPLYSMGSMLSFYSKKPIAKITVGEGIVNSAFIDFFNTDSHINILYGGSSSGKSYALARMVVLWILQGHSILVVRKTAVSLRKSVFSMVKKAINSMKLHHLFTIKESSMEIISNISRGCAMFVGVDDEHKLLSITPIQSEVFDMLFIEEAVQISEAMFNQLLLRMRGEEDWNNFTKRVFLLFNPIFKRHWIFKRFFQKLKPQYRKKLYTDKLRILHTTYKDNPHLSKTEIENIESMRSISPYHYMVYGLGEFGVLGKRVLQNVTKCNIDWESIKGLPDYIGGDFGFTNDPTAVVFCKYDEKNKRIYIYDEIYEKSLTNDLVSDRVEIKVSNWGLPKRVRSNWDCAEPKSIKELQRNGIKAEKASKPKESILRGLDWLQQHQIIVDSRCINFLDESDLYVWEEVDGEPINTPIDQYNHTIDALRYAFWEKIKIGHKIVGGKTRLYS